MKIPTHAKKVYQGIIFSVYQWEQELFDKSKITYEAIRRRGSVVAIPVMNKKIIMQKEMQPNWTHEQIAVCAGKIDEGKSPDEMIQIELQEETGLKAGKLELLWEENEGGSKIDWPNFYYVAKNCTKIGEPKLEAGEKIELFETTFEEFIKLSQHPDFRGKTIGKKILQIINNKTELEKFRKKIMDE